MRSIFLLLMVAVLVAGAMFGFMAGGPTGPRATYLGELPARVTAAALRNDEVLVGAGDAGLFTARLDPPEIRNVYKVTGQKIVDVLVEGRTVYAVAHVTADRSKQLHVVDLPSRMVARTYALGGSVSHVPGFLPDGQLIVIEGAQVRFMDLERARNRNRVPVSGGLLGEGHLVGSRLYVARSYDGGVAVVDAGKGELVEVIPVMDWLKRVAAVGGRTVLVSGSRLGYGTVNLDTQEHRALDVLDFRVGEDGVVFVLDAESLRRWEDAGDEPAAIELPGPLARAIDQAEGRHVSLLWIDSTRAIISVGRQLWHLQLGE